MAAYIMLFLYLTSCCISAYIGFRLGRDGSVGRSSRRDYNSAGSGVTSVESTVDDIKQAAGRAAESNEKAKDVVGRMRDIVSRHSGNTVSEGD